MNSAATIALGLISILIVGIGIAEPIWAAPPRRADSAKQEKPSLDPHSFANLDQVRVSKLTLELNVDFEQHVLDGIAILDITRQSGCPADAVLILGYTGADDQRCRSAHAGNERGAFVCADQVSAQSGRPDPWFSPGRRPRSQRHAGPDRVSDRSVGWSTTMARAIVDGRKSQAFFVHSIASDPRPVVDSTSRHARSSRHVRRNDPRAARDDRRDGGRVARPPRGCQPRSISFCHATGNSVLSHCYGRGRPGFPETERAHGRLGRAQCSRQGGHEFADVEAMVVSAEKQFGPYRWGRYDILVLPPSFPFGGMENPRLTFATPTVLAGDRSLVSLIAHELAHSWSGNLVTNATWRDFWLNEGFTTYIERRIVEDLYGGQRADMEAVLGLAELREELKHLPEKDQVLHIDLNDRDPDDGMTRVPYEKGALLLRTLERASGRARFDDFLRRYFDEHAFTSITTAEFESSLRAHLFRDEPDAARSIDLTAWLERPGLPNDYAEPKSDRLAAIDHAAQGWVDRTVTVDKLGAEAWSTQEWLRFLHALPEKLTIERMAELDRAFDLTARGNSEIAHQWLLMAIRNQYKPADLRVTSYLTTIGRRKLVLPLYRASHCDARGAKAGRIDLCQSPADLPSDYSRLNRSALGRPGVIDKAHTAMNGSLEEAADGETPRAVNDRESLFRLLANVAERFLIFSPLPSSERTASVTVSCQRRRSVVVIFRMA